MKEHEERTRRMREQSWVLDKIIQATGPDYFWPMTDELLNTVGLDLYTDIKSIRARATKCADISRELARVAAKREAIAKKAEEEGRLITARDNYFSAAACYHHAQGPIHEDDNEENIYYNARKIECYDNFIKNAPRPIERVEIPFEDKSLPGFLHLPRKNSEKVPCVIHLGGMDMFKEMLVMVYGDKLLERGMAVFAFDGPGQNEAAMRKIRCGTDNFVQAGQAAVDFLEGRPEIDSEKIAITGVSMGSFWGPQIAAYEHRLKAVAGYFVCHEPGMNTIFNVACPVFKDRYMWMAGYEDEDEFDKFAKTLSLKGIAANIECPVMIVAGGDDELSPIEYTYDLYDEIKAPKKLVVYEGEHHGVSHIFDVKTMIADWFRDRFDGKPMKSERIFIDPTGRETSK
jgi:dienelactone hydrolase